ncbi:asparagine synthase-related protein [Acidobacteriota bacterium]
MKNASLKFYSNNKFPGDKVFREDEDVAIGFDGYLLNSVLLKKQTGAKDVFTLLKILFQAKGRDFLKDLRGSFTGFIYEKEKDIWHIFTDHLGTKPFFYSPENGLFCFSSSLQSICSVLNQLDKNLNLSEMGAYLMLTFGFMLGDTTLVEGIKKVPAGTVLTYDGKNIESSSYYQLDNTNYRQERKSDIIENLHSLFNEAIKLEYEKDKEFGYSHLATLSGGLDTRMNVSYAVKNGFRDIQTFCFSQSGYRDEVIARQIAQKLHLDFTFYSLDGGDYLTNIDEPVRSNDGLVFYAGASHELTAIKALDLNNRGMIHTGQIGDLVLGSYLKGKRHYDVSDSIIKYSSNSTTLWERIPQSYWKSLKDNYSNGELFAFYERCINGAYNGNFMGYQFTEVSSPFLHLDFFDYSMNIHPEFRYHRKIYIEWIASQNRNMAKFRWESLNKRPTKMNIHLWQINRLFSRITNLLLKNFGRLTYSMTPWEHWYQTNTNLSEFITRTFKENLNLLEGKNQLKNDAEDLFRNGNFLEKTQVLTLLKAVKYLNLKT